MVIKAVLFDIDGTLVDSNDFHVEAWHVAFATVGASFDDQVIHDQIDKGTDMLVPALLPGTDEAEQEKLGEAHGSAFKRQYLAQVTRCVRPARLRSTTMSLPCWLITTRRHSQNDPEGDIKDLLAAPRNRPLI